MGRERFLVTGCAGFIGLHTARRLLAEGWKVRGLDNFSTSRREGLSRLPDGLEFMEGSVADPARAAAAVRGVDRIIHLASVPSVPRSLENPRESAEASVLGTVTLLDAARRAGVRRVVQAASSSAYGDSPVLPRREDAPPRPLSPYAAAKLAQEYYARAFCAAYGLDSVSLRYFNVFGPGQNPDGPYAAVIPKFIRRLTAGERPVIYGDGGQTRDFTHVDNVVEANLRAALHERPLGGETVNVGSGEGCDLNRLARLLNEILGTSLEPVYAPARPGDARDSLADLSKAAELFGFSPILPFREGLARTVAAWLDGGRAGQARTPAPGD